MLAACSSEGQSPSAVASGSGGSVTTSPGATSGAGPATGDQSDNPSGSLGVDGEPGPYGYAAQPTGVDYQPDVVVVEGGASAIRAASADGLTWTVDPAAQGADRLEVGRVLLLSSTAAGRVAALTDTAAGREVTLAPVGLGEVVRNGEIHVQQPLTPAAVSYQSVPALPWVLSTTAAPPTAAGAARSSAAESTTVHPLAEQPVGGPARLRARRLDSGLPPATEAAVEVPVGDWKVKPFLEADTIGLNVARDLGHGLKVGLNFAFATDNLRVDGIDTIVGGVTTRQGFTVRGITGLTVSVTAGAENGELDNSSVKIEVPVEVNVPIPPSPATAGLPLNVKVGFKFLIETALTGANATLVAAGKYTLDGPIGLVGGTILAPSFTVDQSILDNLGGITLGPSGIVLGVAMRFQVGLGTPALTAGPFASIVTSLGLTNGSSLGAPLARCKGATLDVELGGGAALTLSNDVLPILKSVLPAGTEFEYSIESRTTVLHRAQVMPDVPLCQA